MFSEGWNLVLDQGVGGSNPLSPTNLFGYKVKSHCFCSPSAHPCKERTDGAASLVVIYGLKSAKVGQPPRVAPCSRRS